MANDGFPPTRDDGTNRRKGHSKTDPKAVDNTLVLMPRVAAMRASGASFRAIGSALGIDPTWARTLLLKALEEITAETAELLRVQEGERLDLLQRGVWPAALAGDTKATAAVIRIMERRAKLFGLDAPIKVAVDADVDAQIAELAAMLVIPSQVVTHEPDAP
jgi:hypothetical protein